MEKKIKFSGQIRTSNMTSTVYLLLFTGLVIATIQSVRSDSSYEWNVERSSVNPLSVTDEAHYSRDWTKESSALGSPNEKKCEANEHFSRCEGHCQKTCDNYNKPFPCPRICIWGCVCDFGFVRGPDEKCIKKEECPTKPQAETQKRDFCPSFEEYSPCHSHCEGNCIKGRKNVNKCHKNTKLCVPGCTCKSGLIRGPDGTCIRSVECPTRLPKQYPIKVCPENEVYVQSRAHCQRNCTSFNSTISCEGFCQAGCVCKGSMVRGKHGKCIEKEKCPKIDPYPNIVCPKGEGYSPCHAHCEGNCIRNRRGVQKCLKETSKGCVPGCACEENLVRGPDGTCIPASRCPDPPPKELPKKKCPENEVWDERHANCQRNCTNLDKDLDCKDLVCVSGCMCKGDMIRGKFGKCSERKYCEESHPDIDVTLIYPTYTDDDDYIPESVKEITEFQAEDTEFQDARCQFLSETADLSSEAENPLFEETEIPINTETEIPSVSQSKNFCPKGEEYSPCHSHCEGNCVKGRRDINDCLEEIKQCVPGCTCKLGLIRGPNGTCILLSKCPHPPPKTLPTKVCPENEVYDKLKAHCQRNCSNLNSSLPCACDAACYGGCVCKGSMVRGKYGKCIEKEKCPKTPDPPFPKQFCPKGEEFSPCHAHCEGNCVNGNKGVNGCRRDTRRCVPGCACEKGFIRGPDGTCIHISKCPHPPPKVIPVKKCPENEVWNKYRASCQRNFSNVNSVLKCPEFCQAGCICKGTMVRGTDGKCIERDDCSDSSSDIYATVNRGPNEDGDNYSPEAESEDPPFETEGDDFGKIKCPKSLSRERLPHGTENSLFDEKEITLNSDTEMPPTSQSNHWPRICHKNEELVPCPSRCPDDCNNFRDKNRKCDYCLFPVLTCACKNGFVKGADGTCIKPYECPKERNFCTAGEEYSPCESHCESDCTKGEENRNRCSRGGSLCVPGCTCKAGLVRGPDGYCIYQTECPTNPPKEPHPKVCPENEVYEKCTAACQRNCSNIHLPLPCPRICIPGCICTEGLIRGKYGKCAPKDECPKEHSSPESHPPITSPPINPSNLVTEYPQFEETEIPPVSQSEPSHVCPSLERWVPCGAHCQRNCSNKDDSDFRCRPVCIPGCICKKGLVKGPDGKCIEKDKCPAISDSESNRYVTLNPPPYTDDDYLIPDSHPPINPSNSETGNPQFEETEIPSISQSGQFPFLKCGSNEDRVLCYNNCTYDCNNYKDTNRKCRDICPIPPITRCQCKKGFVRGPDKKCIKPSECPATDNCEKGEMYSACHGNCQKDCSNWAFDLVCPKECVPGCVCRSGRIRGPDKKCILWYECPRSSSISSVSENNSLHVSSNAGCPNDYECTISCRHYGHRYGHCTGRNSLVCSCRIESNENSQPDDLHA